MIRSVFSAAIVLCGIALLSAAEIPSEFYHSPMRWDDALRGTATDVSFLNATRPAGANGRIKVKGEEFVESKTGNPVRFIGIGIGGRAVTELKKEDARHLASRLAKNGVNIVRFHNHDGGVGRDSIIDCKLNDTRHFDAEKLDAFEYLFSCLKEEGIYIIMPLKVNRHLKPGDGLPAGTSHKFVSRFNRRWIELQKEFAHKELLHVNPYTGMTAAEDPAVVAVEINNEDCLYRPWVDTPARIKALGAEHRAELDKLWQEYRTEHHFPDTALDKAAMPDLAEFLTALDTRYNLEMRNFLQKDLGVKSLIVDTQMDWGGIAGLEREAVSDYVDSHGYWNHPEFRAIPWKFSRANWYVRNESQIPYLADKAQCKLTEMASWRGAGKPFSISEYDYPYPCDYTVEMMPLLALTASRQNWNALHLFIHGMTVNYDADRINGMFDQSNHPGKIGFFPAAALIYRTGMFEPAGTVEELRLPRKPHRMFKNQFDRAWMQTPGGKWRDLFSVRPRVSSIPLNTNEEKSESTVIPGPAQTTKILTEKGDRTCMLKAEAPGARLLIGHWGGTQAEIGGFAIEAKPFPGNFGAAVLVARDGKPVETSNSLLLTIGGRFDNLGIKLNRRRNSTSVSAGSIPGLIDCHIGTGPVVGTRLDAAMTLPADGPRTVHALALDGSRKKEVPTQWKGGKLTFRVAPDDEALYYEITK